MKPKAWHLRGVVLVTVVMLGSLVVLLMSRTSCFLTTLHLPCGEKQYVTVHNTSKETLKTAKAGGLPGYIIIIIIIITIIIVII